MLIAIRLPRTEVTLVCYRRMRCRLSVKRRRCSRSSAGCANKDARLQPASVPVRRGLECVEHAKYMGNGVRSFLSGAAEVCITCEEVIIYVKRKKTPTFFRTRALIFCCYSFGASSSAFSAAFGASASAAGASAFTSASAMGAAAFSSSTTDCCTNCSFSSAVRI